MNFYIVQHGQKERTAGDPALTPLGALQAHATASFLADKGATQVLSSPQRRAWETAQLIAAQLGLPLRSEDRLRERMNWGGEASGLSLEQFLGEWIQTTLKREYMPRIGDSSHRSAARFLSVLEEHVEGPETQSIVLVSHGGVTTDLLRSLFGDEMLAVKQPALIEHGLPGCAVTQVSKLNGQYALVALATLDHLPEHMRSDHWPA